MGNLFDSEFIKKLENLKLWSKIMIQDGGAGNRKSRAKGSSVEFSDYREYTIGDDFKRIDWNAYGRFEKLFIKLFMEERESPVQIFLDVSKSMDYGEPDKSIASRRLAAAISYITLSNYDKVSVLCINDKIDEFKSSLRGKNSFKEVANLLENVKYDGVTNIYDTILKHHFKSGKGVSVVISDFFSEGSMMDMIKYLQFKKQHVYICHVLSPQEISPDIGESLRLIDSETGMHREVTASKSLLKMYNRVYQNFVNELEEICTKRGVHYMLMDTSLPIETLIRMVVSKG
ncbi:DUF58 domain-containing protein [Herbivorax sp. ANBcel31]|uniref:DUF58 domain-containing protein n=1 Tax=Herbivorax sp. ANBcel31 TaxID=3069754 RepID=UPI0027B2F9C4|nr:DUF58 domain-containing protein [Herbivorax sp. ANBcel31]MDQ2087188.1 DUF58 domain-containing protein [Herbivorax sp. ANBcel31]